MLLCKREGEFRHRFKNLVKNIQAHASLQILTTLESVIEYIDNDRRTLSPPRVIIVADCGLGADQFLNTKNHEEVMKRLRRYATGGGLLIFGLLLPFHDPNEGHVEPSFPVFFWQTYFAISWTFQDKILDSKRMWYDLNPTNVATTAFGLGLQPYPSRCYMAALCVNRTAESQMMYTRKSVGWDSPAVGALRDDSIVAAVVGTKIGFGWLVYNGDQANSLQSQRIFLQLCQIPLITEMKPKH